MNLRIYEFINILINLNIVKNPRTRTFNNTTFSNVIPKTYKIAAKCSRRIFGLEP